MKKGLTGVNDDQKVAVKAGFPNAAAGMPGFALNLNELVIKHPASTFFLRAEGSGMTDVGVQSGDILVVDKSLTPKHGDIVVAVIDGEFILRHLKRDGQSAWLVSSDPDSAAIALHESTDAAIWGAITYVIHKARS